MLVRDVLVILRPYPAPISDTAIDYAAKVAQALEARASVIACGVTPKVPQRILGDTLISISREAYGNAKNVDKIVQANRTAIKDPNAVSAGTVIKIPA